MTLIGARVGGFGREVKKIFIRMRAGEAKDEFHATDEGGEIFSVPVTGCGRIEWGMRVSFL